MLARGMGAYEPGEANAHMNFQSSYLKTVFNMMGIKNIHIVAIDNAVQEGEQLTKNISLAEQRIEELIKTELV